MLADLKDMLSQHVQDSMSFEETMAEEIENLKYDISSIAAVVEDLENAFGAMSDDNQQQAKKQLETLHNLHWSLLHRVEEVDSHVNMLTGSWRCGGTPGWKRVGYLNMTNSTMTCPSGWRVREVSGKRLCERGNPSPNECSSTKIDVGGVMYSSVCGRMIGYQFGGTTAFLSYHKEFLWSINHAYVDGVSITHSSPRKHIWTFAAGGTELDQTWPTSCPCDATVDITTPKFMGQDFFCESGLNKGWTGEYEFHPHDPLWDGKGCTAGSRCCEFKNPPYFVKKLNIPTSEDIEVRLCGYTAPTYGNVFIELMELYVQ